MITIIEDTRQQDSKHIAKAEYFAKHGIKVVRSKLPGGDYALLTDMSRVIDTKRDLQELYGNLIQDHERFRREADFCAENGIEFIVLIEEHGMKCLEDVKNWKNPRLHKYNKIKYMHRLGKWLHVPEPKGRPPINNLTFYKIMYTFGKKHSVIWEFCEKEDAGERIVELLLEGKCEC